MRFLALIAIMVGSFVLPLAPVAAAAVVRVRLGVTADGIVQVTPVQLAAAGIDVNTIDPRTFALTSLGAPVAILVSGEADGRFTDADTLLFYGEKFRGADMDEKYTDERVYWLTIGGSAGPRISSVSGTPTGAGTPPADVLTTKRAEVNELWFAHLTTAMTNKDTWFWYRLRADAVVGSEATVELPFTIPDPAAGTAATLRMHLMPRYSYDASGLLTNFYHRTTLAVNGTAVGSFDWQGGQDIVHTASVPAGLLSGNTTTVRVGAVNRPHASYPTTQEDHYINYWELDYRRLFRAWNGQFDFRAESAGTREYAVSGWASASLALWDITTATTPKLITGATVAGSTGAYTVRFRTSEVAGQRYWLQTVSDYQPPATIRLRPDTGLAAPAGGADAVIVTHSTLRPAAEALATWHREHGRRAVVVDIQDVYDEFNDGIYHPKAVRALLSWAQSHWAAPAPQYLTLVGDGHWNFKGYNTATYPALPIMIPPYLAFVDPWQGEIPADMLFGELTGDNLGEVAVGRLPVNTLAEAWTVVNKIINYDETVRDEEWQRRALFVADNNDDTDINSGNFTGQSDEIITGYLPGDLTPTRAYFQVTQPDVATTKAAIRAAINAGTFMVQFGGHGNPERWTHELIWTIDDMPTLTNGSQLPVVVTFNCLDGYFAHPQPSRYSMAETMLRLAGGGSVAAISPSSLGTSVAQQQLRKMLMTKMFAQGVRPLGAALLQAKADYAAWVYGTQPQGPAYLTVLLYSQSLYGDPAMMLPAASQAVPKAPTLSIARSGSNAQITWPTVTQNILNQATTITNYQVWRGTTPYFDPTAPSCPCAIATTTTGLSWTDVNIIGNPALNNFWLVRANNAVGASSNSNRVGEFDFALTPGN